MGGGWGTLKRQVTFDRSSRVAVTIWAFVCAGWFATIPRNPVGRTSGCGKTLLAKALAIESQANFVAMKGADLHSKYVGESEQRLRDIFRRARQAACILFFDELDAFFSARGMVGLDAAVSERILAQFLVEMDGIEELKGVLVLGATNRVDRLDEAPAAKRFDEIVKFAPPDAKEREEILRIHLKQKPLSEEVDTTYLSG